MSRLTAADRKSLPSKDFAGPGRSFPINDRNHAIAAKREIKNAPPSARPKIEAKANKMLGEKDDSPMKKMVRKGLC